MPANRDKKSGQDVEKTGAHAPPKSDTGPDNPSTHPMSEPVNEEPAWESGHGDDQVTKK